MESVSIFELNLKEERNQTFPDMLSAKQESILYHVITSLVWRGKETNSRHPAHGPNALPLSHRGGRVFGGVYIA